MKRLSILLAVLFQLAALAWIAWSREDILRNGQTLELATAPVDPRDIFRGDFVRLDYRISTLPRSLAGPELQQNKAAKGSRVFTRIERERLGIRALSVDTRRPEQGLYLSGRLLNAWNPTQTPNALRIKYGIEQYFVEQGAGKALEQRRRREDGLQTPLFVAVALGERGTAVIRAIRWGTLGIGLRLDDMERDSPQTRGADLTLENVSDQPLTLLLTPGQCAFTLEPADFNVPEQPLPQRPECATRDGDDYRAVTLKPGEAHQERFEFQQAPWLVEHKGKPQPIGELPWNHRYRIVYRSPPAAESTGAWIGEIRSAAFHGRGRVD